MEVQRVDKVNVRRLDGQHILYGSFGILLAVYGITEIYMPMREEVVNGTNPFEHTGFTLVYLLSSAYQANNNAPIFLSVHARNKISRLTIRVQPSAIAGITKNDSRPDFGGYF